MERPTAIVYVDGFNLYHRALHGTSHKWLDLVRMSELLLHDFDIAKVRYFTASIKHQPHDPQAPQRQQAYIRALRTDPRIDVHLGTFRIDRRYMPLHPLELDPNGLPVTVRVRKTEEKGSDVNLATHLLLDGFRRAAHAFVVVSNDSDLAEPMRVLIQEFQRTVGLVATTKQPPTYCSGLVPRSFASYARVSLVRRNSRRGSRMSTERSPSRIPGEKQKPQTSLGFRAQ